MVRVGDGASLAQRRRVSSKQYLTVWEAGDPARHAANYSAKGDTQQSQIQPRRIPILSLLLLALLALL